MRNSISHKSAATCQLLVNILFVVVVVRGLPPLVSPFFLSSCATAAVLSMQPIFVLRISNTMVNTQMVDGERTHIQNKVLSLCFFGKLAAWSQNPYFLLAQAIRKRNTYETHFSYESTFFCRENNGICKFRNSCSNLNNWISFYFFSPPRASINVLILYCCRRCGREMPAKAKPSHQKLRWVHLVIYILYVILVILMIVED